MSSGSTSVSQIQLTNREKECLLWAAEGKSSWEIARILNISENTVIFHFKNASKKLNVTNRQQAIARAIAHGLITPQLL
jgi:LuxR family transcriptional activator of bioluminescence operon